MNTRPSNSPASPRTDPTTLSALLAESRQRLQAAGLDAAGLEARRLTGHALGLGDTAMIAHGGQPVVPEQVAAVRALVAARVAGQPLAYLLGRREFWSLPLRVDPRCLIPRPDTERLVECALARIGDRPARVVDLGTGSGAIILALKSERPQIDAWATDRSADTLAVAAANGAELGLAVHWVQGHWLDAFASRPAFDVIVSNPPYIAPSDPHLERGDLRFEPRSALVAQEHGLADLARIVAQARERLQPRGWLLLEHGDEQGLRVRGMLERGGFLEVGTSRDIAGHERVTEGRRPE